MKQVGYYLTIQGEDEMKKEQWKNLYHSYRWMKQFCTEKETLVWLSCHSLNDRNIVERVVR
jgi:hypothetical protein